MQCWSSYLFTSVVGILANLLISLSLNLFLILWWLTLIVASNESRYTVQSAASALETCASELVEVT